MKKIQVNSFISDLKEKYQGEELNFGSSLILLCKNGILFTMVKTINWQFDAEGLLIVDYSGVGGGMEGIESPFQCIIRETKEEINLSREDLMFGEKFQDAVYVTDSGKKNINLLSTSGEPHPLIIFEHKVDTKYLKNGQPKSGYLLLFIYIAKIKSGQIPDISEAEKIPGLVYVEGSHLDNFLKGVMINSKKNSIYKTYIRNKYKKCLPQSYFLRPKFTPMGIQKSGLQYSDFAF